MDCVPNMDFSSVFDWRKLYKCQKQFRTWRSASFCYLPLQVDIKMLPARSFVSQKIKPGQCSISRSRMIWQNTDTLIKRVGSYSGHLKTTFCSIQIYICCFVKSFLLTCKTDRFGQTNLRVWIPKAYANLTLTNRDCYFLCRLIDNG